MFKKIISFFTLITLLAGNLQVVLAEDQTLTAPEPAFVENRIQPENSELLNRFLIGENTEIDKKTYVEQHFTVDVDSIGAFMFKMKRTKPLAAGKDPEELHVELYEEGEKIAEDNLEGVSSATSLQGVKWIFPLGQEVTPGKDLALRVQIKERDPDATDFPYYIIGDENFTEKPIGITSMVYFNGEEEVVTSNLMNIEVLRKPNDTVVINEGSIYKWEPLTSDNSAWFSNASDMVIIKDDPSSDDIEGICNDLDKAGHEYRSIKDYEAELLIKNSKKFSAIINELIEDDEDDDGGMPGFDSGLDLELRTPTSVIHFNDLDNEDVRDIRFYASKDTDEDSDDGFGLCVYKEDENVVDDKKVLNADGYDKIDMTGLNLNTERYLVNSSSNQSFFKVFANKGSYNPKNGKIRGDITDTGVSVKAGSVLKSYLIAKVESSDVTSDGYLNDDGFRVNALVYKIGENGEWRYVNQYTTIQESGDLYLTITDVDDTLDNNTGYYKVVLENVINTNSIRENNNLYFNVFKNVKDYSYKIGETTDGETMDTVLYESPKIPGTKIKVLGLDHLFEQKIDSLVDNGNVTPFAFSGRNYYTIRGDKLIEIGTGFSETNIDTVTEYDLDKDLSNINSLTFVAGNLYAGYSETGLSNIISKITINGTDALVTDVQMENPVLSTDFGDIKNKKIEKYRYLLNTDGEYLYSVSYLLGDAENGNNANKDEGYHIRIYDPNNNLAMIKDIFIGKKLTSEGEIAKKIGYYTNGFFVDKNYIYIIQDDRNSGFAKVVLINKNTFEYEDEFEILQDFSNCDSETTDSDLYACPINGVYDYLNNKVILVDSNSGKIHFYKKLENNLQHVNIPESVELDYTNKIKEYLVEYNYDFYDFIKTEIIGLPAQGEEIDNGDKVITKGFLLKNKQIQTYIGDVVTDVSITPNKQYLLGNGGVYRLVRNKGNSQAVRTGTVGINSFVLNVNGQPHRFRGDYGTVSRFQDGKYIISGEKDKNGIIPTIEYKINDENDQFLTGKISFRNEGERSVTYDDNTTSIVYNLTDIEDVTDSRGNIKDNIGKEETKWISLDDSDSDDVLLFAIKEGEDAKLGMSSGGFTNLSIILNNLSLEPGESKSYDFYIGSFVDDSSADVLYDEMMNSVSSTIPYVFPDTVNVDNKRLKLDVTKAEKIVNPGSGSNYIYPSNTVNIANSFDAKFDDTDKPKPHEDGGEIRTENGFAADKFDVNSGRGCVTIAGSDGSGAIATLELVKYLPEDQSITFDVSGRTDSDKDRFSFYIDDDKIFELSGDFADENKSYDISKGLHIFTWKYGKDVVNERDDDLICVDNIHLDKVLEVFGEDCPYSGSALFYDNVYVNNFKHWIVNGEAGYNEGDYNIVPTDNGVKTISAHGTTSTASKTTDNKSDGPQNDHNLEDGTSSGFKITKTDFTKSRQSWRDSYFGGFRDYTPNQAWFMEVYGSGQVAEPNMFGTSNRRKMRVYFKSSTGKTQKFYYDMSYASASGDDYLNVDFNGDDVHTGKKGWNGEDLEQNVWYTHIQNKSGDNYLTYKYNENDGGDDGATYVSNWLIKEKAPKDGCNMEPLAYNDKAATHFVFPGFDMLIDNDGTTTDGKVKVIPLYGDTFIEVYKRNQSSGDVLSKRTFYGEKLGKTIDFSVADGYVYEIITNRKVSVLMNNFYQDISKSGDTVDDNTPTYDTQNGDEFVIYMPGNSEKKGNLYISTYEKEDDTHVTIKDLTNNKTNYSFTLEAPDEDGNGGQKDISFNEIGEGQILQITSDQPITIYYGLGTKPAISELLSPNTQEWSFPIKAESASDYAISMYSYYDLNQAKVYNSDGTTLINKELSIGEVATVNADEDADIGTFYKGNTIGPVGLLVGNLSSSSDYIYPIKDSTKLFGIGGKYAFSNIASDKLIIIADENGGDSVEFDIYEDGSKIETKELDPFEKYVIDVDVNKFYQIQTTDQNYSLFVFAQKGTNERNTFQTIFKSRTDAKLGTYYVKASLGDKYVKYDVFGDFDYIVNTPVETGNIDPKTMWYTPSSGDDSGNSIDKSLVEGEKIVFNGYTGMDESNPNDYIIDNISQGKYVNTLDYGTAEDNGADNAIEPYLGGLVKEIDESGDKVLSGVGVNNKEGDHDFKFQVISSGDHDDNGPSYIYKKYSADTYFPEIPWKEVYNFILPTGNEYDVVLEDASYFGKRNISDTYFKSEYDNNGKIKVETDADNSDFVDTAYTPIMLAIDADSYDYLELNSFSTISFEKSGSKNGVICFTVQDNNSKEKNICYSEYDEGGRVTQELLKPGKFVLLEGNAVDRNIVSDYSELYQDGTIPLRILGVEITGYKKGDYDTTFSNIKIKNYTNQSTGVTYKANTNIYSPNIPLSHKSKIGQLIIPDTEGSTLFDNENITFTDIHDNSEQDVDDAGLLLIQDDDPTTTYDEESQIDGNSTFTIKEKKTYIVTFRARGEGNKQILISNTGGSKTYINGIIAANNYSGNMDADGNDLGEIYIYKFSTDWGDNEDIKLTFINKGGNFYVGDVRIIEMKDSLFQDPDGMVGRTDSGEQPVLFPAVKEGTKKNETTWKAITYFNKENDGTFLDNIDDENDLDDVFEEVQDDIDTNGQETYAKLITFNNDKNVVNFLDGKKVNNYTLSKATTNLYSEIAESKKIRVGLVGRLRINGENVYVNLKHSQSGCIRGTGDYPDYDDNDIVAKTCLIDIDLNAGFNTITFEAISHNDNTDGYEGLYKDWILNPLVVKSGSTKAERLSFKEETNIKMHPDSFIVFDKDNDIGFDVIGDTIKIGRSGEDIKMMSLYSIDRDYSLRTIPSIESDRHDRTTYVGDVVKFIQYGNAQYPDSSLTNGSKTDVGSYKSSTAMFGTNLVKFKLPSTHNIGNNDVIEIFIKFLDMPKELEINFNSDESDEDKDRKIYWGDNYLDSRIDDNLHLKKVGDLDDLEENKTYRILIPANTLNITNEGITGLYLDNYDGQIEITDANLLKGYTSQFGNNLKVTFDVDVDEDTSGRDIIFGVTNNSTDPDLQGYKVVFSEDGNSTSLYKNGMLLQSVTNDDSYIQDDITRYNLQFIKSGEKLIVGVKYDYEEDGVTKTKVVKLIEYIELKPLLLKNSNIVFETKSNKYTLSNIKIADGEDKEQVGFFHAVLYTEHTGAGQLTVTNEYGETESKIIDIRPDKTDYYVNMKNLAGFSKIVSDVEFLPNLYIGDDNRKEVRIEKLELMRESQIPPVLAKQDKTETMGSLKVRNGSRILQAFDNTKEKIMGVILFVNKDVAGSQPEGLTLKMYKMDTDTGLPDYSNLLVEKTVNTDAIGTEMSKLKIIFPAISVEDGEQYAFELTTANKEGLNLFGTTVNTYEEGYAFVYQKETPEREGFEFNELGKIVFGTKGTNGYRGDDPDTTDHEPTRVEISGDNIKLVGDKDDGDTITIPHSENLNLSSKFSFIIKGKFPEANSDGRPLIIEKQSGDNRNYGVYIANDSKKLHVSFSQVGLDGKAGVISGTDYAEEDVIIGVTFDTINGYISLYKNGTLTDKFELGVDADDAVIEGDGIVSSNWEDITEKGRPLTTNSADLIMMGQHNGWASDTMELDYVRMYDLALTEAQINQLSKEVNSYKYRTPYDLGFFMITKDSEIETIEERTYFLDGDMIKEVDGDLYLNGYDAGSGVTELFLTGNMTFRVKGNIYINADRIRIINDNRKEGIDAISYIGFIADKDIIINSNVKDIQGGYFAKNSIKTVFSNEQLKIYGLLAANEVDLQNRVYMGADPLAADYIPCSATHTENCSFTIEFDNRIYKKMPPLFYQSNNKQGVTIKTD